MKKTTTLIAAILIAVSANAQLTSNLSQAAVPNTPSDSQSILWEQETSLEIQSGIISVINSETNERAFCADDFQLDESSRIDRITVFGFQDAENLEDLLTGFDLYIYANSNSNAPDGDPSIPGSGLFEFVNISPTSGAINVVLTNNVRYAFEIDLTSANNGAEVILPPGNYWVAAAPRIDAPFTDTFFRWNWWTADTNDQTDFGINDAHFIDPENALNSGYTTWTSFSDIPSLPLQSVALLVEGEPATLSVEENISDLVSVYPNPTTDILNLKISAGTIVNSASIVNVLGNNTGLKLVNNIFDTSTLSSGIYILTLNTSIGRITQKIIKQ